MVDRHQGQRAVRGAEQADAVRMEIGRRAGELRRSRPRDAQATGHRCRRSSTACPASARRSVAETKTSPLLRSIGDVFRAGDAGERVAGAGEAGVTSVNMPPMTSVRATSAAAPTTTIAPAVIAMRLSGFMSPAYPPEPGAG